MVVLPSNPSRPHVSLSLPQTVVAIDHTSSEDSQSGQNLLGKNGGGGKAEGGRGSPPPPGPKISMCGLLSLQYYQPYFDVDTSEVKTKLLQAIWPMRKTASFLGEGDSSKVDLYGPVWVSGRRHCRTNRSRLLSWDMASTNLFSALPCRLFHVQIYLFSTQQ